MLLLLLVVVIVIIVIAIVIVTVSVIVIVIMLFGCQTDKKDTGKTEKAVEVVQVEEAVNQSSDEKQQERLKCNQEVCIQLRNHNSSNQSFEIYMLNSVQLAGFQCDFPGIKITGSDGGFLKENGYQTSNSAFRLLSFSMQAKLIPVGIGVLTEINYNNPSNEVCMTEIIFAGIGGAKLSTNAPECMKLN